MEENCFSPAAIRSSNDLLVASAACTAVALSTLLVDEALSSLAQATADTASAIININVLLTFMLLLHCIEKRYK